MGIIIIKFLISFAIIYSQLSLYSSDYIHSTTNGSLSTSWRFNITMFMDDMNGVIVYGFDSENTQFGIIVSRSRDGNKSVKVRFNKISIDVSLKQTCGCDPCNGEKVNLNISYTHPVTFFTCNHGNTVAFISRADATNENQENNYLGIHPLPKVLKNSTNTTYIMIGNIGPQESDNNVTIYPLREQMIGCLHAFYYNDARITFTEIGTKVRSSCQQLCNNNMCNGGRCHNKYSYNINCDCSSTALNGPYCNKSMNIYNDKGSNTYEKINNATRIYLKMTWRQLSYKQYCLMDIVNTHNHVVLSINKNNLMMDYIGIGSIDSDGFNFINVTINNYYLYIKINYKDNLHVANFSLDENTQIKIGFSDTNGSCEKFEGTYDLHFDSSELRMIAREWSTVKYRWTTSQYGQTINKMEKGSFITITVVSAIVGSFVVLSGLIVIMYRRSTKKMKSQIDRLNVTCRVLTIQSPRVIFTEPGVYGKVEDSNNYDYIQDGIIYGKVE